MVSKIKWSSNIIANTLHADDWYPLPNDIAKGVTCRLITDNGFLFHFKHNGARILDNFNDTEDETLDIRAGSIKNTTTGVTYCEGDYVSIKAGERKELVCVEDAYVYCVMEQKA